MGVVVGERKSNSPPCRRKRDESGAPSGVEMSERVGHPPLCVVLRGALQVNKYAH